MAHGFAVTLLPDKWVAKGQKAGKKKPSKNSESHGGPSNLLKKNQKNPQKNPTTHKCKNSAGNKDALLNPINGNLIRRKIYERHWKRDLFPIRENWASFKSVGELGEIRM